MAYVRQDQFGAWYSAVAKKLPTPKPVTLAPMPKGPSWLAVSGPKQAATAWNVLGATPMPVGPNTFPALVNPWGPFTGPKPLPSVPTPIPPGLVPVGAVKKLRSGQVSGFGGFSLSKLTNWVGNTVSAIGSGNTTKIAAQVAAAIPGSSAKAVVVAPPAPTQATKPGIFSPGGFVEQNQTVLLLAAAGMAMFLVLGRRGSKAKR